MGEPRESMTRIGAAKTWVRAVRALCVFTIVGFFSLGLAPMAGATVPSFTWTGDAAEFDWSAAMNWEGETRPPNPGPVTLIFPQLTSPACTSASPIDTCYLSDNDMSGLSVESLTIDDGDDYKIKGGEITLGGGGLTASPAIGTSGEDGVSIDLPIELGASQTWSITGHGGQGAENGVAIKNALIGPGNALAVSMSNDPLFVLEGDTEVGPISIDGTQAGAASGVVLSLDELNATDGSLVSLSNVGFEGEGAVGALKASATDLAPGEPLDASSVSLDASSKIIFGVSGVRNSELVSQGPIELGGSSIELITSGPSRQSCPSLKNGDVYTLISTTGTLSGSFGNAPQGKKIVAEYPEGCLKIPFYLEISYHESGATKTVTATVIETSGFEIPIPENHVPIYEGKQSPWIAESAGEGSERQIAAVRAREREEAEARARALAEASAGEVSLVGTSIAVQSDGMALVKLDCKGGANCVGKLTLSAQATSKAKGKKERTITIGTAGFSIAAGKTGAVKVKLDAAGRGLLSAAHGHLSARLTMAQSVPAPAHTQTKSVHLLQRGTRNLRDGGSKK